MLPPTLNHPPLPAAAKPAERPDEVSAAKAGRARIIEGVTGICDAVVRSVILGYESPAPQELLSKACDDRERIARQAAKLAAQARNPEILPRFTVHGHEARVLGPDDEGAVVVEIVRAAKTEAFAFPAARLSLGVDGFDDIDEAAWRLDNAAYLSSHPARVDIPGLGSGARCSPRAPEVLRPSYIAHARVVVARVDLALSAPQAQPRAKVFTRTHGNVPVRVVTRWNKWAKLEFSEGDARKLGVLLLGEVAPDGKSVRFDFDLVAGDLHLSVD